MRPGVIACRPRSEGSGASGNTRCLSDPTESLEEGVTNRQVATRVNLEVAPTKNNPQRPSFLGSDEGTRVCRRLTDETYLSGGVVGPVKNPPVLPQNLTQICAGGRAARQFFGPATHHI